MTHTIASVLLVMTVVVPQTPSPKTGSAPQVRRAAPAKPQPPMTLRQVIESLSSLRNSTRVEALISRRGVQFQANPEILSILTEFGASPKLLSMIPAPPPPPPAPPPPKTAGDFTVVCEPAECMVVIDDMYKGATAQNRKTVSGLHTGDTTVQVFADGFEGITRRVVLREDKPLEEKFSLKRNDMLREQSAGNSLLKLVASLGGIDGIAELGDIEGTGMMHWVDSAGQTQEWALTFNKRIGKDLSMTFKTKEGQCSTTTLGQSNKQECRGGLKNGGENIADQAASLFLSYQIQDVLTELMKRKLIASELSENRVESPGDRDTYVLDIGADSLPASLIYRIGDTNSPIQVQYSNYLKLNRSRYPGRIAIGRVNSAPVWIFTINTVRNGSARGQ